jgi:hypothetical protein
MGIRIPEKSSMPAGNGEGKDTNNGKGKKIANKGSKTKIGGKAKQSKTPVHVKKK